MFFSSVMSVPLNYRTANLAAFRQLPSKPQSRYTGQIHSKFLVKNQE